MAVVFTTVPPPLVVVCPGRFGPSGQVLAFDEVDQVAGRKEELPWYLCILADLRGQEILGGYPIAHLDRSTLEHAGGNPTMPTHRVVPAWP